MPPIAFALGGPWDIAILGGVVLLLFGGSKIGGFGKSLGEGIKEFKKATHDEDVPSPTAVQAPVAPQAVQAPIAPAAVQAPVAPQALQAPVAPVVIAQEAPAPSVPVVAGKSEEN